jgi:hypothetical protein
MKMRENITYGIRNICFLLIKSSKMQIEMPVFAPQHTAILMFFTVLRFLECEGAK